jgi:hypothetical protein
MNTRRRRTLWTAIGLLWLCAVVAGLAAMARYANRPGAAATAPDRWPPVSRMVLDREGPTLVMIAHPRCDCTRASLVELAEVLARAPQRPKAYVVFLKPAQMGPGWEQTDLWRAANSIPHVTVLGDDDGLEARRFGAETSGQTLLYDANARLLFSGGTTIARGHPGDSAGLQALLDLLRGGRSRPATAPVFGCPLFTS